jgi:hypothetical protein
MAKDSQFYEECDEPYLLVTSLLSDVVDRATSTSLPR